jgi:hypothetical protein
MRHDAEEFRRNVKKIDLFGEVIRIAPDAKKINPASFGLAGLCRRDDAKASW